MSIGAITGSGSTANLIDAIKALRAGAVAATQAVSNQPDPRVYADVEEQQSSSQQQAAQAQAQADQRRQTGNAERREREQDSTPRPSSTFLTQALAQEQDKTAESPERASATAAGSAAYANAAYSDAAERASTLSGRSRGIEFEVLSPNPSAASGRGVDLSV